MGRGDECFPPALRFELNPAGEITDIPIEVLAADIRETGDGEALALAKVVARLLDLETDDVYRRAERAQKRATHIRNSIIAVLALLAVAASGSAVYAWQQLKTNEAFLTATLKRATGIVNTAVAQAEKYNIPRTATLALLTQAEGMFEDMAKLGRVTPELQRQKAWMLIQFARNYEILGDTTKQGQHAEEAQRIMAALAASNQDDLTAQRDLYVGLLERGLVQEAQGNLPGALKSYQAAIGISERLAKSDPQNEGWQRDLSVSHNKIGNVQMAQGYLTGALQSYQAGLVITERLAKSDPANAVWQRDLSVSHDKIGDVRGNQGDLVGALKSYRARHVIAERLAKSDPANAGWQRDLSVSFGMVATVLEYQGDLAGALNGYRKTLEIQKSLAKSDLANAGWQRDLVVSYGKLAQFEPQTYWPKALAKLEEMDRKGILRPADRQYLDRAKRKVAELENE